MFIYFYIILYTFIYFIYFYILLYNFIYFYIVLYNFIYFYIRLYTFTTAYKLPVPSKKVILSAQCVVSKQVAECRRPLFRE